MVPALFPDVFSNGIWPEIHQIHDHDPELKELAESLPLIALRSKAPGSVRGRSGLIQSLV